MATPVSIALQTTGLEDVRNAIKGVKHSFIEMDQTALASSDAASKKRIAALKAEGRVKLALLKEEEAARAKAEKDHKSAVTARARSEREYQKAIARQAKEPGSEAVGNAFMKGEGFGGMLKAAGLAGIAIGALSSAISFVTDSLKQFAGFVISDVVKPRLELQTKAAQVANNAGGAFSASQLEDRVRAVGVANNIDPMELVKAQGRFQDLSGDPKAALDALPILAMLSKSRGADLGKLAELGGNVYQPGMKSDTFTALMLRLTKMGETGKVALPELAGLGGSLNNAASNMTGEAPRRIAAANALLQIGKGNFKGADVAATGLESFMRDSLLHGGSLSTAFKKSSNGQIESITDPAKLMGDILAKTQGGNKNALHGLMFSDPAATFIGSFKPKFDEAMQAALASGKTEAQARQDAAKAVEAYINSTIEQTSTIAAEEAKRQAVLDTAGERLEAAFTRIKERIGEAMPEIEDLINEFVDLAPDLADAGLTLTEAFIDLANIVKVIAPFVKTLVDPSGSSMGVLRWLTTPGGDTAGGDDVGPTAASADAINSSRRKRHRKAIEVDHSNEKGTWKRVGPLGELQFIPEDVGGTSEGPAAPNASGDSNMSTAPASPDAEPQQEAADAHKEVADNATKAADSMERLTSCVEDLISQMDGANRSQCFTQRR